MALDDIQAELGLLLTKMQMSQTIVTNSTSRSCRNEFKAYGMPLPEDLVHFERHLEAVLVADKEAPESVTRANDIAGKK